MSVHLAYDGSINGDWIARYAIRLAARGPDRRLDLIHVEDGSLTGDQLRTRLDRIATECNGSGVALESALVPLAGDVFATIVARIPGGAGTILICGARVRGGRGFLAGTVSERLLRYQHFTVMAVRVVQPGLLGAPRNFLLPVSGDPAGLAGGLPLLRLFAPDILRVHLLRVMTVGSLVYRWLPPARTARLRQEGWAYIADSETQLVERLGLDAGLIDAGVVVSDDWAKEIVIAAGRQKSGLIFMEAPRRSLGGQLLRGDALEAVLRRTPCDVAVYRGPA